MEQAFLDKISADGKDLESRFAFAQWLFTAGRNAEAIEQCLNIMQQNKAWKERAAYTLLIDIFNKLGPKDDLVIQARKRLAKVLF